MATPFLTARWSNLVLISYKVDPASLRPLLHPALELDTWDGCAHVSLVAFDFLDTRVRGCRVPGYVNFPEVNLRAYVRHGERRGVSFLRELVPSRLVAMVARLRYHEPYHAARMRSAVSLVGTDLEVMHDWELDDHGYRLRVRGSQTTSTPPDSAIEHHFKEHEWGFGRTRAGALLTYRVEHPVWAVREVREMECDVYFGALYGSAWERLSHQPPVSVVFAVGSEVAVYPPTSFPRSPG